MIKACGGFVVGTTSCFTSPGLVRQINGAAVGVSGIRVGGWVAGTVGVVPAGVGEIVLDDKQAESTAKSVKQMVM